MPVTVQEAVRKGLIWINLPFGGFALAGFVTAVILDTSYKAPTWMVVIVGVGGFLLGTIYWCVATTKWKIWAYQNVDHIHEFEDKAREARLIDTPSDFMTYQSRADKQKLEELKRRFQHKDVFSNDILVPPETVIRFSKKAGGAMAIVGVLCAIFAIFAFQKNYTVLGRTVFGGIAVYFIYTGLKEYFTKKPQIIISDKGIQTLKTPFHPWSEIKNEDVRTIVTGGAAHGNSNTYLVYTYPGGSEKVDLDDLTISDEQLQHLLHVYRLRSGAPPSG
jgi:hypothetical protein